MNHIRLLFFFIKIWVVPSQNCSRSWIWSLLEEWAICCGISASFCTVAHHARAPRASKKLYFNNFY